MSSRPLLNLVFVMIAFWILAALFWPRAVLYYFTIAGSILALIGIGYDVKRYLEKLGARHGRR